MCFQPLHHSNHDIVVECVHITKVVLQMILEKWLNVPQAVIVNFMWAINYFTI
jgi:hypothetical protein